MEILELIKEVIKVLNVNELDAFLWLFISILTILLFRHFYSNIDTNKKRENNEINDSLMVFKDAMLCIKKHDDSKINSDDLYVELNNLLPICSARLKDGIINVDLNNAEKVALLKEKVKEEFNLLKYSQHIFCKRYSDSAIDFYTYHFENSGFFNIFITASFTLITLIAILTFISFFLKLATINTLNKIIFSLDIIFFIIYIFLVISYIDLFIAKRFKATTFNITALIIVFLSPIIFVYKVNIFTTLIFCAIISVFIVLVFPKTIKQGNG